MKRIIISLLIGIASMCFSQSVNAVEFRSDLYYLSAKKYSPIPTTAVLDGFLTSNVWISSSIERNPWLLDGITCDKLSTIEIIYDDALNGLGSSQPFILEARKQAAKMGANVLQYESGVVTKNTQRNISITFLAYRIAFQSHLIPALAMTLLDRTSLKQEQVFKMIESEEDIISMTDFSSLSEGTKIKLLLNDGGEIIGIFSRFNDQFVYLCPGKCAFNEKSYPISEINSFKLLKN